TRSKRDWSSDVCSSDLTAGGVGMCLLDPVPGVDVGVPGSDLDDGEDALGLGPFSLSGEVVGGRSLKGVFDHGHGVWPLLLWTWSQHASRVSHSRVTGQAPPAPGSPGARHSLPRNRA